MPTDLLSYGKGAMIRARDLRKSYANVQAVNGVSLELVAGETFGLLGPNGAGKTTTIHMLIGVLRPDSGEVSIQGVPDPTRAEVRRQLGVAPQIESLYDELSAAENLAFFGRLYGLRGVHLKERVSWCVELRLGSADPVASCVLTSNRTFHVTGNRLLNLHVAARDTRHLVRPPARELLR